MVEPSSQMICHIQIFRSRIGRRVVEGRWRREIKRLDKGRDLRGTVLMDERFLLTLPTCRACACPPCGPRTGSGPAGPRTGWRSPGARGGSRPGSPPSPARTAG